MKVLPESIGQGGTWENRLVTDLAYIRNHLRYPVTKKTLLPVIVWAVLLVLILSIVNVALLTSEEHKISPLVFLVGLNVITIVSISVRYWNTLKFDAIPTEFFLQENKTILEQFLKAQQLLVFRHPEMPEVFQILSRNLNYGSSDEKREVIIFIADDRRILINSHFTGSDWAFAPQKRHHKQMAKSLKEWIKKRPASEAGLVHQTF